jgi:hypothetical protein
VRDIRHHDRVAIRRRLGERARADHRPRAWTVLDDHLLAEGFGQRLREHAANDIGRAAHAIGRDEPDGSIGTRLRNGLQRTERKAEHHPAEAHGDPSITRSWCRTL